MIIEGGSMKLLRIDGNVGQFLAEDNTYHDIDKISKDALLWIVEKILDDLGELEEYDEERINNQAHQVVYKSIYGNLKALEGRRQEFVDEAERIYLEDYKKYVEDASKQDEAPNS